MWHLTQLNQPEHVNGHFFVVFSINGKLSEICTQFSLRRVQSDQDLVSGRLMLSLDFDVSYVSTTRSVSLCVGTETDILQVVISKPGQINQKYLFSQLPLDQMFVTVWVNWFLNMWRKDEWLWIGSVWGRDPYADVFFVKWCLTPLFFSPWKLVII